MVLNGKQLIVAWIMIASFVTVIARTILFMPRSYFVIIKTFVYLQIFILSGFFLIYFLKDSGNE